MKEGKCPFCSVEPDRVFHEGENVLGLWDKFPVSDGHALLIPKRHVEDWFKATSTEQVELAQAISVARDAVLARYQPDGFNIGINVGEDAGQTVMHLHVHVIPRYRNDVEDPTGGVRMVIPNKGNYLAVREAMPAYDPASATAPISIDRNRDGLICGGDDPLLPHLREQLDQATQADIAVAFVKDSGVRLIMEHLRDLLDRDGRLRLLTGDYLGLTDPEGLHRLLDLEGDIQIRAYECRGTSFHPKAYIFRNRHRPHVAFVGSSNLSAMAMREAIEWNYRIVSSRESGFQSIVNGFEDLFRDSRTREVTRSWICDYAARRTSMVSMPASVDVEEGVLEPIPEPHSVQIEALAALEKTRDEGNRAGLVVLATGLGKTWLSAFDTCRPEFSRVLYVAHREEILTQAMSTFRRIRPGDSFGRYTGKEKIANASIVFASIQTLGRQQHLQRFDPEDFDYIIVDEFHHAAARTYRHLLDHFSPKFLLGLTATPERTDGGDLLALCGENLVFRLDLVEGIRRALLCPFRYFGVPDEVDYTNIPWRSGRFNDEALTDSLATRRRAENALEQYRTHGGKRTLAFCCSQRHADFMARFFCRHDLRAVAVHSGEGSAPRASSLARLQEGELDIICAVDMFNEGVDLPQVDTVMMLRPTESRIIWLQQFGRGLRRPDDQKVLTVIDYIGNHRVFLLKPQTLLDLPSGDAHLERALNALQEDNLELPPGCEITYELKAIEILRGLLRRPSSKEVMTYFLKDFQERHGERPRAVEAYHEGYSPRSVRQAFGSWHGFLDHADCLQPAEQKAVKHFGTFLGTLETTPMTRSYKMLLLQAMLNQDAFPGEISIDKLAAAFSNLASRSALLTQDVGRKRLEDSSRLKRMLETNPIKALVEGRGTGGNSYFEYVNEVLRTNLDVPNAMRDEVRQLVRELVDWRLAEYLDRPARSDDSSSQHFTCSVGHANGRPILFLPDRTSTPGLPSGWTSISANGEDLEAKFTKTTLDTIRRPGTTKNVLPEILHNWFGPDAGRPETQFKVTFEQNEDHWLMTSE